MSGKIIGVKFGDNIEVPGDPQKNCTAVIYQHRYPWVAFRETEYGVIVSGGIQSSLVPWSHVRQCFYEPAQGTQQAKAAGVK